jgi:hypothetical protein
LRHRVLRLHVNLVRRRAPDESLLKKTQDDRGFGQSTKTYNHSFVRQRDTRINDDDVDVTTHTSITTHALYALVHPHPVRARASSSSPVIFFFIFISPSSTHTHEHTHLLLPKIQHRRRLTLTLIIQHHINPFPARQRHARVGVPKVDPDHAHDDDE